MSEAEVPEGIDPETGELLEPETDEELNELEETESEEPGEEEAESEAEAERETELAAERQEEAQAQQVEDAQIEKNTKALNRASQTYIKKVVETLGPDLEGMQMCPLCADHWPGLRFPVMPSPEHLAAVRVAIGLEPGDNLPKDNYSRVCSACDGWGFTDSGSKVSGQGKLTCFDCEGRGWLPVGSEREGGRVTALSVVPAASTNGPPAVSSNDPPEVEKLKQLGYVVVAPIPPVEVPHV